MQIYDLLPEHVLATWPRTSTLYTEPPRSTLEVTSAQEKSRDVGKQESAVVCALLRRMLAYNPDERLTAVELLAHPWFKN